MSLLNCRGCLVVRVSDLTGNHIIFPLQLSDILYFSIIEQFSENIDLYSTKCFLFSLKCTKIVDGWCSAPDPLAVMGWGIKIENLPSCYGCLAMSQTLLEII